MVLEGVVIAGMGVFWAQTLSSPIVLEARRDLHGGAVTLSRPTLLGVDRRTLDLAEARPGKRMVGKGKGRHEVSVLGDVQVDPLGLEEGTFAMLDAMRRYEAFYQGTPRTARLRIELPPPDVFRPAGWGMALFGLLLIAASARSPNTPADRREPPLPKPVAAPKPKPVPALTPEERRRREARLRLWLYRVLAAEGCFLLWLGWWGLTVGLNPTTLVAHRGADGSGTVTLTRPTIHGMETVTMTLAQAGRAYEDPESRGQDAVMLGSVRLNPLGLARPPGVLFEIEKRYNAFYRNGKQPADFSAATERLEEAVPFGWLLGLAGFFSILVGIGRSRAAGELLAEFPPARIQRPGRERKPGSP